MYSRDKIATIDKVYIWTFLFAFVVFIYGSFESYYIGELSHYLSFELTNPMGTYSMLMYFIIATISLLFFHRRNTFKGLTFLGKTLFVFSIYILFSFLLLKNYSNIMYYMRTFLEASLWIYIYLFFYTLKLRYDIEKYIPKFIIIFFTISIGLFLRNYFLNNSIGNTGRHYIESYYAVALIPAISLLKGKYKYAFFMVTIICSIIAGKRTGMITCIVTIIMYVLMVGKGFTNKIKTILFGSVLLLVLFLTLNQFMGKEIDAIVERIENIEEDEGSGRGSIYKDLYNEIANNDDFSSFTFGKGYNEVINSKGSEGFSAHNEFIEVAYDYGIIGFIIFVFVFIAIFRIYRITKEHQNKVALLLSFIIFLMFSLTSHTILATTSIVFLCMTWGYFDAQYVVYKRNKNIKSLR